MSPVDNSESLNAELVRPAKPEERACEDCGSALVSRYACRYCDGEDEAGYDWFCPKCEWCCGC